MAASGTLQARAFASNAQLPLPGVAIRITERTPEGMLQQLRIAAIDPVIVPVFGDVHAEKGCHKHSPVTPARPGSGGSWAEIPLKTLRIPIELYLCWYIQIYAKVRI